MKAKLIMMLAVTAVFVIGYYGSNTVAFAQYMGNVGEGGETGTHTLEESLELAMRRMEAAEANPSTGSGTPYMDAGGVVGASVIAGAVFGGIATAFFVRGRSGKYAAYGRG